MIIGLIAGIVGAVAGTFGGAKARSLLARTFGRDLRASLLKMQSPLVLWRSPMTQDVCKVQIDGYDEPLKVTLNRATINGLVDAFGRDSKDWQGHPLTVEIDKLPGKKFPLYLAAGSFLKLVRN